MLYDSYFFNPWPKKGTKWPWLTYRKIERFFVVHEDVAELNQPFETKTRQPFAQQHSEIQISRLPK